MKSCRLIIPLWKDIRYLWISYTLRPKTGYKQTFTTNLGDAKSRVFISFFNLHGFSCFILILTSIRSANSWCIYVLLSNFVLGKILNLLYFQLTYLMHICQFLSPLDKYLYFFLIIRNLVCLYACFFVSSFKKGNSLSQNLFTEEVKKVKIFEHNKHVLSLLPRPTNEQVPFNQGAKFRSKLNESI